MKILKVLLIFILAFVFISTGAKVSFAYGYLTHVELMRQTFNALGTEFLPILDMYSFSALLGAIGPNFFWNKAIKKELHNDIFFSLPLGMANYIKSVQVGEKRGKLMAFLYGYLTHIAGDFYGHTLGHRLSGNNNHDWKLWRIFLHQDLYVAQKYQTLGKNKDDIKINMYDIDTEIVQMWFEVYQHVSGARIKLKDFMSNYDYNRLVFWWLAKEIKQPMLRIFLPYQPKLGFISGFNSNFESAKQTSMEFIKVVNEFLHGLSWHHGHEDKIKEVINNNYRLQCGWG